MFVSWHLTFCSDTRQCLEIASMFMSMTGGRRSRKERLAELLDFATEHFLNDAKLAQQHAQNLLIEGLYSEQYWVSLLHKRLPAAE